MDNHGACALAIRKGKRPGHGLGLLRSKNLWFGVLVAGLEEVAAELGLFGVLLLRIRFSGAGGLGTAFAVATTLANDILLRASSRAFVAT